MGDTDNNTALREVEDTVKGRLGALVTEAVLFRDQLTFHVRRDRLREALEILRNDPSLEFHYLVDIIGQERVRLVQPDRFEMIYILHSFKLGRRIRVKATAPQGEPALPSVSDLWPAANWFEREAADMYGVVFTGHPDPRRILTWEGFEGHPLRKDFPFRPKEEVSIWQRTPDEIRMMTGQAAPPPALEGQTGFTRQSSNAPALLEKKD